MTHRYPLICLVALVMSMALSGCGSGGGDSGKRIVVTTLEDAELTRGSDAGKMTLRAALALAELSDTIVFDRSLNGGTINLTIVGDEHTKLPGEVYAGNTFSGYQERDYGASALYARKRVTIDASELPDGITLRWAGGDARKARVLAVFGNLTLRNVTVTGGHSEAVPIAGGNQPYTLARGGWLAVWGIAKLEKCVITGNQCTGDTSPSRDRGTYGGGIYANGLDVTDTVISGNTATGYGAAGGGVYSVGGADNGGGIGFPTRLERCAVTGNRVTAQHAYGGGIFTLSGGPVNLATMTLINCTIARNVVEDHPDLPEAGQYYYRGGGIYMGGGSLALVSCTIAENEVTGYPATFNNRPNMGGGGVAATIGNAHVVENVHVRNSIVVGNTLNGENEDWFAGSILGFYSEGWNLFGRIDFSHILVPVPEWMDLNRKHYPTTGDRDGVHAGQALELGAAVTHPKAVSAGRDRGMPAVLWYPPGPAAVDKVPWGRLAVRHTHVGCMGYGGRSDTLLNFVLQQVRTVYGSTLGSDFGASFGDVTGVAWHGPRDTWPTNPQNTAWITFWRDLDREIGDRLGMAGLAEEFWSQVPAGDIGNGLRLVSERKAMSYTPVGQDQRGRSRPNGGSVDIGAIER